MAKIIIMRQKVDELADYLSRGIKYFGKAMQSVECMRESEDDYQEDEDYDDEEGMRMGSREESRQGYRQEMRRGYNMRRGGRY